MATFNHNAPKGSRPIGYSTLLYILPGIVAAIVFIGRTPSNALDELKRALKLMNPKGFVCLLKTT